MTFQTALHIHAIHISSSLGNRTVAGSHRYDSWQLQFWDSFYFSIGGFL